jgi:histidinol-phosphate aminotransferase
MPLSRRSFVRSVLSIAPAASSALAARGLEALAAGVPPPDGEPIRLDSNENPLGPGPAALAALERGLPQGNRYPMNSRPSMFDLRAAIARAHDAKQENVVLGAGSREILRNAVQAFATRERPLVTAAPSYEAPERRAEQLGIPVRRVPVDAAGRIDLDGLAAAARGAGLVFLCNPNNPTGTVLPAAAVTDFLARVGRESPGTIVLVDEAYHDYVTDPAYASAAPTALAEPHVFVTRTFSKAHGMAGLRVGYAVGHPKTIAVLQRWAMPYHQTAPGVAAALASLEDRDHIAEERRRNAEARAFAARFFETAGYRAMDSQTNFLFVDLRRPAAEFREACRRHSVLVGRDFPPLEKTHVRISIGTMEEMRRAVEVFRTVLGLSTAMK